MRRWNTWGGQGGFVLPCDEGFTPYMFNRQTYGPKPNSQAHLPQPDYVQWSFWQRHFTSFITLCSSHCGHLSYCCWWVQLMPQIVRSNKEGTHVSPAVIKIRMAKSTLWLYIHIVWYTQYFLSFHVSWHQPTHHCLALHNWEENGWLPWQRFVPLCYSCDICGDTFDPLVNSVMQELCRDQIGPGCPAYPAIIEFTIYCRFTVGVLWPGHYDNCFLCDYPSKQDQSCIHLSWKQNKISTVYSNSADYYVNMNSWYCKEYVVCYDLLALQMEF